MQNSEQVIGDKLYYQGLQIRAMPGVHEATLTALHRHGEKRHRILEIGSGTGAFTRRLHEQGFNVTASGIDPNDYQYQGVRFQYLDLSQPLDSSMANQFDVVVATEVIEHVENIFLFLRHASHLLAPEGLLILTTPNVLSLFSRLRFLKSGHVAFCNESLMDAWGHIQVLPEWLLRKAAENTGLTWIESCGVGTPRYDMVPRWHKWVHSLAPVCKIILPERFEGELKGSNLLMICKKSAQQVV